MKTSIVGLLLLVLAAGAAKGSILFSDDFNYPDGPIVGAPGSPWLPNTGTANSALVTNQALIWSTARTEDIYAPLSMTVATNAANPLIYSSFTIRFLNVPSAAGTYLAHFTGDPVSAHRGRVWVFTNGTPTTGKVRIAIVNSSTGSTNAPWPSDLETNITYTVVTRLDVAAGVATLWINPSAESDPSVTASDTPGITNILYYAFRQATGIGTSIIDKLRVGTSFGDVAGANNPPSITSIPAQRTGANTPTGPIPFTVGDAETPAESLLVSGSSANPTLVPNANISFGGSGSNRTVTITPAAGQQGTVTITINVADANNSTNSTLLQLSVGLPSISDIPNQTTATNTATAAIPFTVSDTETAAGSLIVTATSSNPLLVPDVNVVFGGSGSNRTVTVTPVAGMAGFTIITVMVSDGTVTAADTFVLTVFPNLGLVKFDDFNRPDGPLVTGDGAWISHSGTFAEAQITNNALKITSTRGEDVSTDLTNAPYLPASGAILYASFKLKVVELPTSAGDYFAHFKDDGVQNFRGRVYIRTLGAAPGAFRLGLANNATAPSVVFPSDLNTNSTYLVVTRYNVVTGIGTLWVNPSSESSSSVTASDNPTTLAIHTYAFREAGGIGTLCVDDLKIAGTFAEVVPVTYSLSIIHSGQDIQISWPAAAEGYVLQSTETLAPSNWQNTTDEVSVQAGQKIVRRFGVTGNQFFRLINPN